MKMKLFLLLFTVIVIFTSCNNDNDEPLGFSQELIDEIDEKLDSLLFSDNLPGLVVKVYASDNREYLRAKGVCNLETGDTRTVTDPFRIASITKTFTASVIHSLISEGKLSTSDKLSMYFPDFPNADIITVRNLLRMRSGIADYGDHDFLEIIYNNPLVVYTTEDLLQISIDKADQFYTPDSITEYCNVNFTLLGEIAAKIEGKSIRTLISERVIEPLGLSSTIYPADTSLSGKNHGYCWDMEENKFEDYTILNPLWAGAAGAIISNAEDLGVFVKALYTGELLTQAVNTAKNEALQMNGAPPFIKYGEGIINFGAFWGHNGTIFGFSSEMWYLPEEDAIIIIDVNRLDENDVSQSTNAFLLVSKILFPEYVDW